MNKKEVNFSKAPNLIEEIKYKEPAKEWRPIKKFLTEVSADFKTGEIKGVYYTPKTAEEEKKLSDGYEEKFKQVAECIEEHGGYEKHPPLSDEQYRYVVRKIRLNRTYSNMPLFSREKVVLVLDKYGPISWNVAFAEVEAKTPIGEEILKKLEKLKKI